MRRFFLPLFVAALWLAAFLGGAALRCDCARACCAVAVVEAKAETPRHACCRAAPAKEAPSCCAKHGKAGCDQCAVKAKPKAQVLAQVADAPLFFAPDAERVFPVPVPAGVAVVQPPRAWAWSLPPPDTLLGLRCALLI